MTRICSGGNGIQDFNLGLNCGDAADHVWSNRHRMLQTLGVKFGVFAHQVHGTRAAVWPEDRLDDRSRPHIACLKGDALVSAAMCQGLVIQVADCQSVLIADPVQRVVANVHSGWRGSIGNIIGKTVAVMISRWGCRPDHMYCGIGPSLGPCCAEFVHYRTEIPMIFWPYRVSENHFDFWRMSFDQLVAEGVPLDQIEVSRFCTKCNQHLFFSYRGHKQTGRFATLIGWSSLPDGDTTLEVVC